MKYAKGRWQKWARVATQQAGATRGRAAPLLAPKIAAQHRDNRRAFVTTNRCFPSKATKIPSLSWRRDDRFSVQSGKDQPNPRAARAWQKER
jgi:hypothetical protein